VGVEFRLLGSIEADVNGRSVDLGPRRQRCVLVALVVDANRTISVDELIERAWGSAAPRRARETLYTYLSRLRHVLAVAEEFGLSRRSGGYQLTVDEQAVDLHRFHQLTGQGRTTESDAQAGAFFEQALVLWRGEALHGLDTPWINGIRAGLDSARFAAELDHADRRLRQGQHAELVGGLAARTAANPLDERLAGQFLLALYRCGRQAEALEYYARIRARLIEELGADPSPTLQHLHQRILTADPALAAGAPSSVEPAAQPIVPRQLPAAPRSFTGRAAELAALSRAIDSRAVTGDTMAISALGGAGGVGKTWLALHWAHRNLDRFPDGQLFVNLRGFDPTGAPMSVPAAVRCFLDALGVEAAAIPVDLDAQVGLYRSLVADKRMLIVVDNAADVGQVAPLLPGSPSCTVLVTSRDRLRGLITAHDAHPLPVDVLPEADAHALLTARLGERRLTAEPAAVSELLACCAGLPLALSIVAGRAQEHPEFPLSMLAADLRNTTTRLGALDDEDPATSVRAGLSWSYDALSPIQAQVFALLGLAPGPDISLPAVASLTALSPGEARSALRALERVSLVQQPIPGRYRMHDLVRLYATEQADHDLDNGFRRRARQRLVDFYLHSAYDGERLLDPNRAPIKLDPPGDDCRPVAHTGLAATLAWFDTEHDDLLAAHQLAVAEGWHDRSWSLAWTLGTFLWRRGHLHDNTITWQAALTAAERLGEPTYQAQALRRLGLARARAGEHGEAVEHLQRSLELAAQAGDIPGQGHTQHSLAWVRGRQGDDELALSHTLLALDLLRTVDNPVWEGEALNLVGWYSARLGHCEQAAGYCEAALTMLRKYEDREGEADTLDSLGYIAHQLGRHGEAVSYYREALLLFQDLGHTYEEPNTLAALGDAYAALGEVGAARVARRGALELYRGQHRGEEARRIEAALGGPGAPAAREGQQRSDP
jgi:DNA-binding SARP family transcriptional activator/tetratricopeptide (TPR) repeat protein